MLSLLWFAIFGLIVGAIAKFIMPGKDPGGIIVTAIIGMVGSIVGTFIGRLLWGPNYSSGWIMAIIGTVVLLALYRVFAGRRSA